MTDQETLTKAIEKALAGGYVTNLKVYPYDVYDNFLTIHYLEEDVDLHIYQIIFSHDFAKALWGEQLMTGYDGGKLLGPSYVWQYHLQQMVIAEEPIKYLGQNL